MGGLFAKKNSLFVDDLAPDRLTSIGFSPNMFTEFEWASLKTFCNKRDVSQTELNLLYRRHCTYKNCHLLGYRVRLEDIKEHFLKEKQITMELVGLFFPTILLKEYQGLSPPFSHQEISFARFFINSYIFCALPMPDLICVLFSTIKQTAKAKRNLTADTMIPLVTFNNVVKIMTDSLERSAALTYILKMTNRVEATLEEEISLEDIIMLGMKYPLLFFEARRFQNHMRRTLHGDIFWSNRCYLKTRLEGLAPNATWVPKSHEYESIFSSEYEATRVTAVTIITDIFHVSHSWDNPLRRKKPVKNIIYSTKNLSSSNNSLSIQSAPGSPMKKSPMKKKYSFQRHGMIVPAANESTISLLTAGTHAQSGHSIKLPKQMDQFATGKKGSPGKLSKNVVFGEQDENDPPILNTMLERQTAQEIDIYRKAELKVTRMKLKLTVVQYPLLDTIDGMLCVRLKDLVGYREGRALVLESKMNIADDMPFLVEYDGRGEIEFNEGTYYDQLTRAGQEATIAAANKKRNSFFVASEKEKYGRRESVSSDKTKSPRRKRSTPTDKHRTGLGQVSEMR